MSRLRCERCGTRETRHNVRRHHEDVVHYIDLCDRCYQGEDPDGVWVTSDQIEAAAHYFDIDAALLTEILVTAQEDNSYEYN